MNRIGYGCLWLCMAATAAADTPTAVGCKIDDFTLEDQTGQTWSLSDLKERKVVAVIFLGTECPLVRLYAGRLDQIAQAYREKGVALVGIDANVQDSPEEVARFVAEQRLNFPVLLDPEGEVANQFGAQRTPEAFVLDRQRTVRYHGRIDDQFTYGVQRPTVDREHLVKALDELLAGHEVSLPETEVVGCHIGRPEVADHDHGVTYSRQISRILQNRCVDCHRPGEIGPFALTEYDEVVGWAEMIEEVVRQERMPPWHADPRHGRFANDRRLSEEEKRQLLEWIEDGTPRGDPAELPQAKHYVDGWRLPKPPDLEIAMRAEPFDVPARGAVDYQYFTVDPGFASDRWVKASEVLPGNRAVVHHVLVFVQPPGEEPSSGERGGFLAAYVPGLAAPSYPEGMAKFVPARSKLIFQVHYTPVGTPEHDLTRLGLVFAEPSEVTHQVITASAVETALQIPPGDSNHRVEADSPAAPRELRLLSLMPHMHLRGKSFRYEARYADGRREVLLDVPKYDFNWQTSYVLAEPKPLPPGTRIHCVAHFDNSAANPANPDPKAVVRWGDQTWEEMMIGYFDVAVPVEGGRPATTGGRAATTGRGGRIAQLVTRFDRNDDGAISRDEIPDTALPLFEELDRDADGRVTAAELAGALGRRRE